MGEILGGGGGGSSDSAAADQLAQISQQLFAETDPLRRSLIGRSESFLSGGLDVRESPLFLSGQQAINRGFQTSRRGILEDLPAGGSLLESLSNLQIKRGRDTADFEGSLQQGELGRALSLATGQPLSQSIAGLGQAGAIQGQFAQADADRQAGLFGALGTGAGAFFGGK